ncbi:DUF5455 family protein [Aliivibrio fischeri]|uniref:DUF5455 family protein n=1 Tax=Aliivibrio fischeri TaxID=668 RepID=UPI0007C4FAC4|nr:DUF5455 family protein [Aliivibrio fischeri]MCE7534840.1 DUF5455 family protein [Aliivibrio fischeri]MCE7557324.1 DUF5455 family protein [Aliivibrio fischeri]MCE7566963.1 DUF5455 family protein [Aliivibrio fischeri]MUH97363.1 hypothetical protein [Aliivibrio fischeri]MUI64976.1 hypothetical protein [Aliivibrio fischeri]
MPVFLLPIISGIGNVLRVPAIAAFIAGLAAQLVAWFSTFVARGVALNLAVIVVVVGLAVAISSGFWLMLEGISYVLPPEWSRGMAFITPSNAVPCLSTIAAARVTRWVWEWQIYAIHKATS